MKTLIYHGIKPISSTIIRTVPITTYLNEIIQTPLVSRAPIIDDAGITYAYDLVINDGFYLIIFLNFIIPKVIKYIKSKYI